MDSSERKSQIVTRSSSILVVSAGLWHPSFFARWNLAQALKHSQVFNYRFVSSLEALPRLDLSLFQGLVLYFHHRSISAAALSALQTYVARGGGVLALHSASASFKTSSGYYEIIGGRFIRHGPVTGFEVIPASQPGALFAGQPSFRVRDELYRHEYDPAVSVHLYTEADGEREPVLWTRSFGDGRVCYCALGHTAGSLTQPQVFVALQRALSWITAPSQLVRRAV